MTSTGGGSTAAGLIALTALTGLTGTLATLGINGNSFLNFAAGVSLYFPSA